MRILGVDPGSRATGWAVVAFAGEPRLLSAGVLRPPTSLPFAERLRTLYEGISEVVAREAPDEAAVERVFSGVNPQSLIALGQARGVLLLALAVQAITVHEITPAEVKRAVTGSGAAEKEQVRRMLGVLLRGLPLERTLALDAADAAAVALAHGYRTAPRAALRMATPPGPDPDLDRKNRWRRRPAG